ncbi:MAG: ATP-grasp domain-containing protein [Saprospiraceae bacterium]|nr:ATP-grasp domain-containing protein [Saprospiraceae bacterium]MDW8483636.1 ATP-grasp domain-containing protein [Saprospiraceae bacterium]
MKEKVAVLYACPNFTANATKFIDVISSQPDVRLAVVSQEFMALLPLHIQQRLAGFRQVSDVFQPDVLTQAALSLQKELGDPLHRIMGAVEALQWAIAVVRERMGIPGMRPETILNFRDKQRMKDLFRRAGIPCARSCKVTTRQQAHEFAASCNYAVVVKPPDGAGSLTTFRVSNPAELDEALQQMPSREVMLEEFILGQEHAFDTFSLEGKPLYHSISCYYPNPLEVMREAWIQWQVVTPFEVDSPQYDDIRALAFRALEVLGMQTGVSHLEWFRRPDGSIAISEVAARPPGAQFMTLAGRAADFDAIQAWARLVIFGEFTVPRRQYAVGAAYLRGQGKGRVKAVSGLDIVEREIGHLITDFKIPSIGQEAKGHYEGEGYIIVRHPDTGIVRQALSRIVSVVRVHVG